MNHRSLLLATLMLLGCASLHATAERSAIGKPLPELPLDYLKRSPTLEGKAVLLEFWATWCGPCRTTIPHLNNVYRRFSEQGLVIIGVTSEEKSTVDGFLARVPMDYVPALDKGDVLSTTFGVTAIPHAVLYDRSGKAVWEGHPVSLKDETVQAALASTGSGGGVSRARSNTGNGNEIISTMTVPRFRALLESAGIESTVDKDGDVAVTMHGFKAYFFVGENAVSFQMGVRTKASLDFVNKWNKEWRYSRTYLDSDGDPVLRVDLDLDGGVTRNRIIDYFGSCSRLSDKWTDKLAEL